MSGGVYLAVESGSSLRDGHYPQQRHPHCRTASRLPHNTCKPKIIDTPRQSDLYIPTRKPRQTRTAAHHQGRTLGWTAASPHCGQCRLVHG
eukprot:365817-Chlamydomonas_euryale.AAC.1